MHDPRVVGNWEFAHYDSTFQIQYALTARTSPVRSGSPRLLQTSVPFSLRTPHRCSTEGALFLTSSLDVSAHRPIPHHPSPIPRLPAEESTPVAGEYRTHHSRKMHPCRLSGTKRRSGHTVARSWFDPQPARERPCLSQRVPVPERPCAFP